jgi:ubiquinone/menaquinone biosynthesis C-methylase UbiE
MEDTGRAFDKIAEDYDLYRTAYPMDFIRAVLGVLPDHEPGLVCEIGPGSGQATIRLAELGYSVTGVEPGAELLAIAKRRLAKYSGVNFIHNTFQHASIAESSFDIVFAANALHWVPESDRFVKPFNLLKPGGHLVAVWRWDHPLSGALGGDLNKIVSEYVPKWKVDTLLDYEEHVLSFFRGLISTRMFTQSQLRRIPYSFEITSDSYSAWLGTMGMVAELTEEARAGLCKRVKNRIDQAGGKIIESGETVILVGRRPFTSL